MRQQDRKLPLWECECETRVHVFLKMSAAEEAGAAGCAAAQPRVT